MSPRMHPIFANHSPNTVSSKYSKGRWRLLKCLDTGLVYLDNPVAYEQLQSEYAWEKTYEQERLDRNRREPVYSTLSAWVKVVRRKVSKIPKVEVLPIQMVKLRFSHKRTITLLDVGCGQGNYTRKISEEISSQLDKKVIPCGIEISDALAEKANRSLAKMEGEVVRAPAVEGMNRLIDRSQDLVLMHSFLEHEVNPLDLLRACREKLATDGLLIIKVPNYSCWNRWLRQEKWCGFRYPDHVNYFSPNNLKMLLGEAGLKVFRMNFFDRIPTSDNMWVIAERI